MSFQIAFKLLKSQFCIEGKYIADCLAVRFFPSNPTVHDPAWV